MLCNILRGLRDKTWRLRTGPTNSGCSISPLEIKVLKDLFLLTSGLHLLELKVLNLMIYLSAVSLKMGSSELRC
ncbi:hypothetical protein Pint_23959 [Pistacia integerrima]|uniref:Uncharacterized protein n=1 Tax=Pistacia integerrima TaxID=434235 RepID=A0ACC0YL07_9ROSI|nr:hypothetical protein Pint_23959 [Pistacia integerrima]